MAAPPIPEGFSLVSPGSAARRDPWEILRAEGFEATNGFRTDADVERIEAQGYSPAPDGAHNRGDGVDLVHPRLSPAQQTARLNELAKRHGWSDAVILDEGHHRHLAIPGWGAAPGTPGTPNSGLPPIPEGFNLVQRGPIAPGNFVTGNKASVGAPTGRVADGDTFRLSTGNNARLLGADAFELRQTGRSPAGQSIPLGMFARSALKPFATPNASVSPTGDFTFGRPVVTLNNGRDAGQSLLREGWALAVPEYLKGSPQFGPYMEAERLARLNLVGAHGNTYQTPKSFREGDPSPWAAPESAEFGQGQAVFGDEPMPFMGLRPEIEAGYLAIWNDPKSKPEDLIAFAKKQGFALHEDEVRRKYAKRFKDGDSPDAAVEYAEPPKPVTDLGQGATGAFARGFVDPVNITDEVMGVAHSLGFPSANGGRENVWNSDRRFGDILWNNIDQNRSIFAYDDQNHPVARIGGQLASGVALPYGAGARTPIQLARLGAIEGGLAGFGAAEGNPVERVPNALLGTAMGAGGGYALGHTINALPRLVQPLTGHLATRRRLREIGGDAFSAPRQQGMFAPDIARQAATEAAPIVNDGLQNAGPTPAARSQPRGGVTAAMRAEDEGASVFGPVVDPLGRSRDYLNLGPVASSQLGSAPFGITRPMGQRLGAEEIAALGADVDPRSVLPRPGNRVESLEESMRANPGSLRLLQAPDEMSELTVRKIPSRRDFFKFTRVRGPLDVTQRLRTYGGIQDQGGELAHLGITNEPRRLPFGGGEQFLGRLIDNERGMSLDEATHRLWEEGYFPEFSERPTPDELLDRLKLEAMGQRSFHPDDLEEAANYESALADRYRIEAAADEGRPLVEEVGETVTLDDLVANTPPAGAYEEMPRLTGRIGNINLNRLEKPEDVGALIEQVAARVGGFDAAARGRITHEETRRLAEEIGLKPEDLLKRKQGQALNAEQLYATRVLVQKSRQVVANLARKAVGGSDEDKLRFRKAWIRHVALEEQVSGATAETARAMSQLRMIAKGGDARAESVRAYLRGAGGGESVEDAARAIVDLMEDPAKASHFMRESLKPKWRDKFNELWINSLLSGLKTHVVNFTGNMITTLLSLPEQALTAGIGRVLGSQDRVYLGEVGSRVMGMADSAVDALKAAKQGFITGEPSDAISKVEARHYHAIGGKLGQIIRTPTRALTASDEFWKTINSSAELRALAYRKAMQEGGSPADIQRRYESLIRSPDEEMIKQAREAARYYTFQTPLGESGRAIQQWANTWPGAKIILPFVRTPINLLKFAGERSVFAPLMGEVRDALRAGGRRRDQALARMTLGTGLSVAAVMAALDGRITGGGPTDFRERAALQQAGWQPYSIRIGDQWVSYQRFDPFSMLIGAAADFAEIGRFATRKEADQIALDLSMAIAKNATNKTWLSGLSDGFEVLSDPERYGGSYVRRLAGSLAVPALVNQTAQSVDPHMRSARTVLDAIKARIPVLSESVPVRRDVWGEPIERGSSLGPDIASPIYMTPVSRDPVRREVARLGVPLSMPQRFLKVDGRRVDLTPQQYDELVQLTGKQAKQYLDQFMQTPEWRSMNDEDRREEVREALSDFRDNAREALKQRHPELGGAEEAQAPSVPPVTALPLSMPPQGAPPIPPGFSLVEPGAVQ